MGIVVSKFGGTSLATAQQFLKVANIVRADERRRYVVPSAPGKAPGCDQKVTDLLYACHRHVAAGDAQAARATFDEISRRFIDIVEALGTGYDIQSPLEKVWADILLGVSADHAASRGEYLNGLILAHLLQYDFIDPAQAIFFDDCGEFDELKTQQALVPLLADHDRAVIPGFYGSMSDGAVKTFSRGGSDITGAIVARAARAALYENWTDVSGFMMADPRIVQNPKTIAVLTYQELRELSYMGATVLHEESIFPVREAGIPIAVKNTNAPDDPGTRIVAQASEQDATDITGVAGRKGFAIFHIEKDKMNNELGFGRRMLSAFEKHGISFEHLPTGIDTMSVVVQSALLEGCEERLFEDIRALCNPDVLEVDHDLALIATVGRGMIRQIGTAGRVFSALGRAGVNVRMIDQGSSEINIIVGIAQDDFEAAVRAIYAEFAG
jgi:aspartate kinase